MSVKRHGNPGEWAKVRGTVVSLWPLFLCFTALGAMGTALVLGRHAVWFLAFFSVTLVATAILWRRGLVEVESFFKGARGEERVAGFLDLLPGDWDVFHDYAVGGYHVDHVVVGPAGVFAIETKNWNGELRVESGELLYNGRLPDRSPLGQTGRQADSVGARLKSIGCECEVVPVLCMASDAFTSSPLMAGRVTLVNSSNVVEWLAGQPAVLSQADQERVAQLLASSNA